MVRPSHNSHPEGAVGTKLVFISPVGATSSMLSMSANNVVPNQFIAFSPSSQFWSPSPKSKGLPNPILLSSVTSFQVLPTGGVHGCAILVFLF